LKEKFKLCTSKFLMLLLVVNIASSASTCLLYTVQPVSLYQETFTVTSLKLMDSLH